MHASCNACTVFVYDYETLIYTVHVDCCTIEVFGSVCTATTVCGKHLLFAVSDGTIASVIKRTGALSREILRIRCPCVRWLRYCEAPELLVLATDNSVLMRFHDVIREVCVQAAFLGVFAYKYVAAVSETSVFVIDAENARYRVINVSGTFLGFQEAKNAFYTDKELVLLDFSYFDRQSAYFVRRKAVYYYDNVATWIYRCSGLLPKCVSLLSVPGASCQELFFKINVDCAFVVVFKLYNNAAYVVNVIQLPKTFDGCALRLLAQNLLAAQMRDGYRIFTKNSAFNVGKMDSYNAGLEMRYQHLAAVEVRHKTKNTTGRPISTSKQRYIHNSLAYVRFQARKPAAVNCDHGNDVFLERVDAALKKPENYQIKDQIMQSLMQNAYFDSYKCEITRHGNRK